MNREPYLRRYSFGFARMRLRVALALFTVFACVLGWQSSLLRYHARNRAMLQRLGGRFWLDEDEPVVILPVPRWLCDLMVPHVRHFPAVLRPYLSVPRYRGVWLDAGQLSVADLSRIGRLPGVRSVWIHRLDPEMDLSALANIELEFGIAIDGGRLTEWQVAQLRSNPMVDRVVVSDHTKIDNKLELLQSWPKYKTPEIVPEDLMEHFRLGLEFYTQ